MPSAMEVSPSPGTPAAANGVATAPFPTVDANRLVDHLVAMVEIALGATRDELDSLGSLLHKSRLNDTIQRCTRFATDSQQFLYVQKDIVTSLTMENGTEEPSEQQPGLPRQFNMA
jgi:dynein heavy chain 1, cytosolic